MIRANGSILQFAKPFPVVSWLTLTHDKTIRRAWQGGLLSSGRRELKLREEKWLTQGYQLVVGWSWNRTQVLWPLGSQDLLRKRRGQTSHTLPMPHAQLSECPSCSVGSCKPGPALLLFPQTLSMHSTMALGMPPTKCPLSNLQETVNAHEHGSALVSTLSLIHSPRALGTSSDEKNHHHKPQQAIVPLYRCDSNSSYSP